MEGCPRDANDSTIRRRLAQPCANISRWVDFWAPTCNWDKDSSHNKGRSSNLSEKPSASPHRPAAFLSTAKMIIPIRCFSCGKVSQPLTMRLPLANSAPLTGHCRSLGTIHGPTRGRCRRRRSNDPTWMPTILLPANADDTRRPHRETFAVQPKESKRCAGNAVMRSFTWCSETQERAMG